MTDITSLHQAYRAVIAAAKTAPPGHLLGYAAGYADYGLELDDARTAADLWESPGRQKSSRVQLTYVRGNLSSWRGEEAKAVRLFMDRLLKSSAF